MAFLILVVLAVILLVIIGAIMGMVAKARTDALQRQVDALERAVSKLGAQAHRTQKIEPAEPPPVPAAPPVAEPEPTPLRSEPPAWIEPERQAPLPRPPEPPPAPIAPAGPSAPISGVEAALGMRWLTWIGVGMLFLGIAFFLKYAYDRDWLGHLFGPRLRIATAATAALALACTGWRSLGRGMAAFGQGLLGGGQALLYLTIFAAFQPALLVVETPLIGTTTAFALMALVTAGGLVAAVRLDAVAMAFIAVLGGIAAPVLVSSGQDARDVLCAYLLLLDLGVLGVALHRRWRALDLLAFAGTALLFAGWFATWYDRHPQPDYPTLAWLGVSHLVFLLLPFAHHWRQRSAVTVERFALALANLAWTLGYAAWMLHDRAPFPLAAGCLAGAALYLGLGIATSRRIGEDRRTRDGFIALAALLLSLGLFYLLPVDGITTAWFAEAAALLWLGYRYAHPGTRWIALVVLAAAMARTLAVHLPGSAPSDPLIANRWFVTLLIASAGLGAFALVHRRHAASGGEGLVARICGTGAWLWLLLAGSLEILRHADGQPAAWRAITPAMAFTWLHLAGVAGFLIWAGRRRDPVAPITALLPLAVAAVAAAVAYDRYPADALPLLNGCGFGGLAVCSALLLTGWTARRIASVPAPPERGIAPGAALALALTFAAYESAHWSHARYSGDAADNWTLWLLGLSAVLGASGGLWRFRVTSNRSLRAIALLALAIGLVLPLVVFLTAWQAHLLFLNARCALVAAAVATALGWAGCAGLRRLRWVALTTALIGLSAEPPAWLLAHVADPAEAGRAALFSVTVMWLLIAGVLLGVGFRRAHRPLRLVALALFALTAAKLLLLDMSGAQQLYRILAFVLVGLVFVAASWLYHRMERRFARRGA